MKNKYKNLDLPINFKVRLILFNNEPSVSIGVITILKLINETGSLNKACKKINMSYSKGLRIIRIAENDIGFKLVDGTVGGAGGGGSKLTENGLLLCEFYTELNDKLNKLVNETLLEN